MKQFYYFILSTCFALVFSFTSVAQDKTEYVLPFSHEYNLKEVSTVIEVFGHSMEHINDFGSIEKKLGFDYYMTPLEKPITCGDFEKTELPNGDVIYRLKLTGARDCKKMGLTFKKISIAEHSELRIFNTNDPNEASYVALEPFNYLEYHLHGRHRIKAILGQTLYLELFEPKEDMGKNSIEIDALGYNNRKKKAIKSGTSQQVDTTDCRVNVNCPAASDYVSNKNSTVYCLVVKPDLVTGDFISGVTSGVLVTNCELEKTKYVLTVHHSFDSRIDSQGVTKKDCDASDVMNVATEHSMFIFNHDNPDCDGDENFVTQSILITGFEYIDGSATTDYALLEMKEFPPDQANIKPAVMNYNIIKSEPEDIFIDRLYSIDHSIKDGNTASEGKYFVYENSPSVFLNYTAPDPNANDNNDEGCHVFDVAFTMPSIDIGDPRPGGSGAPVYSENGLLVGLHIKGQPGPCNPYSLVSSIKSMYEDGLKDALEGTGKTQIGCPALEFESLVWDDIAFDNWDFEPDPNGGSAGNSGSSDPCHKECSTQGGLNLMINNIANPNIAVCTDLNIILRPIVEDQDECENPFWTFSPNLEVSSCNSIPPEFDASLCEDYPFSFTDCSCRYVKYLIAIQETDENNNFIGLEYKKWIILQYNAESGAIARPGVYGDYQMNYYCNKTLDVFHLEINEQVLSELGTVLKPGSYYKVKIATNYQTWKEGYGRFRYLPQEINETGMQGDNINAVFVDLTNVTISVPLEIAAGKVITILPSSNLERGHYFIDEGLNCYPTETGKRLANPHTDNYLTDGQEYIIENEFENIDKPQEQLPQSIKIYPNPNNGSFKLEGENIEYVHVYDNIGKLMLTKTNVGNSQIDLPSNLKGMYIIELFQNGVIWRNRIIVQ